MTSNQDFYQAPNLQSSLFNDLQLPQQSTISLKKAQSLRKGPVESLKNDPSKKKNKYLQNQDDHQQENIRITLGLGQLQQISNIQKKPQQIKNNNRSESLKDNNNQSLQKQKSMIIPSTSKRIQNGVLKVNKKNGRPRKPQKTNNDEKKQQVDIDKQIGQIAQWEYRGTGKNNQSDNQQQKQEDQEKYNAEESFQTIQIKKKINDKLKKLQNKGSSNQSSGGPGSLKAKAEQLKRKNQQKQKSSQILSKNLQLKHSQIKQMKQQEEDSDVDDHWDKINKKAVQDKKSNIIGSKKQLTQKDVMKFYMGLQLQNEKKQVQNQQDVDEGEDQESGCFGLFGCLKENKKKGERSIVEKQLLCLSKVQFQNWEQNMFILKRIWTSLTGEKFQRYGNHWNQIGFQGRDPSTDLRSTGILSIIQWYNFIESHYEYSTKIYNFTIELQFPLALSAIKVTSLFLNLLKNNKISGKSFQQLQQTYNALHFTFFSRVMKIQIGGTPIGEFIDKQIEEVKKNYNKARKTYVAWKQTGKSVIV